MVAGGGLGGARGGTRGRELTRVTGLAPGNLSGTCDRVFAGSRMLTSTGVAARGKQEESGTREIILAGLDCTFMAVGVADLLPDKGILP